MSYLYFGDRVKVSTATTGTPTMNLGAATSAAFRTFAEEASAGTIVDGESVLYLIEDGTDYEYGLGTYTAGSPDTLSRDTVLGSSNSGSKINLSGAAVVGTFPPAAYLPRLDSDLQLTLPNQCRFLAYNSATDSNVTGNGGAVTVDFDTEVSDVGGNFASDTFTAPVAGTYRLSMTLNLDQLTSGTGTLVTYRIVTSNRTMVAFDGNPGTPWSRTLSGDFDMDAGDTATVTCSATGMAGDTADVSGAADLRTSFSGHLVA